MPWALWKKSLWEVRWLLSGFVLVMFLFQWWRFWMISQLPIGRFRMLLRLLPAVSEKLSPVPYDQLAEYPGRIAIGYHEPLVLLVISLWAVGRGSDAISGELGRGTMELLLAQPVRRIGVLATQAAVALGGAALLALAAWCGTACGMQTTSIEEPFAVTRLLPAVVNVFALGAFLAGFSTLASAFDQHRGRTVGIVGGLYIVSVLMKMVGRSHDSLHALCYASFFSAFEPVPPVVNPEHAWTLWYHTSAGELLLGGLGGSAILCGLGAVSYLVAAWVFCRRDLPAPL